MFRKSKPLFLHKKVAEKQEHPLLLKQLMIKISMYFSFNACRSSNESQITRSVIYQSLSMLWEKSYRNRATNFCNFFLFLFPCFSLLFNSLFLLTISGNIRHNLSIEFLSFVYHNILCNRENPIRSCGLQKSVCGLIFQLKHPVLTSAI